MKYNKLGKSDLHISLITYGCWEMGGGDKWELRSDEGNIEALRTALKNGINSFDTAVNYGDGHSEVVVGKGLEGKQQECIIATKVRPNDLSPKDVRKSFEESLQRLRSSYIDIFYIHWPNANIPLKDTLLEFNRLKDEKLIKAIGVSNFSIEQLKEATQYAQIDAVQMEYSLLQRDIEKEILPFCVENSISVLSYSSIAKGILTGAYHFNGLKLKPNDFRSTRRLFLPEHIEKETELLNLMKEIAESKGATISQIAVSWLLNQKGLTSAVVGTQSEHHLADNIKATDVELTTNELDRLDRVSKKVLSTID
ncbi:MAG TPA: aldo/keto reductase [Ruminiclostridium sp.]